jgi:hypothetical protein
LTFDFIAGSESGRAMSRISIKGALVGASLTIMRLSSLELPMVFSVPAGTSPSSRYAQQTWFEASADYGRVGRTPRIQTKCKAAELLSLAALGSYAG